MMTEPVVVDREFLEQMARSLLGAILLDNRCVRLVRGLGLMARDFTVAENQVIFLVMSVLSGREAAAPAPDDSALMRTLIDALTVWGKIDQAGGRLYVLSLLDGVPRPTNAESYARIIIERAKQRRGEPSDYDEVE